MNKLFRNSLKIIFTFLLVFTFSTLISPSQAQAEDCFFNYMGVNSNGSLTTSVIYTGTKVGNQCRTSGVPILLNSWFNTRPAVNTVNSWPCTGRSEVGQSCTNVPNGKRICVAGPQERVIGCVNLNTNPVQYAEISRENLTSPTATPTTPPQATPTPTVPPQSTPTPTPSSVSACNCTPYQTYYSSNPVATPIECTVPDSRNKQSTRRTRISDSRVKIENFACITGGVLPPGNCNCSGYKIGYNGDFTNQAECLGENNQLSQCFLPSSNRLDESGRILRWEDNRCNIYIFRCGITSSQPPMSLQVYAGEYMKMMRGLTFDARIDVNGDNVKDLRDFYRLWQMWRDQGTAGTPLRINEESGDVVSPIEM